MFLQQLIQLLVRQTISLKTRGAWAYDSFDNAGMPGPNNQTAVENSQYLPWQAPNQQNLQKSLKENSN